MFRDRVRVTLPRDGGTWGGVRLTLIPPPDERSQPVVALATQVGFERLDGQGWDYWTEDDIVEEADFKALHDTRYSKRRVILFETDESRDRLLALLQELGVPFKKESEFRGFERFKAREVLAQIDAQVDRDIARAIAKMGFNYMAYTSGAEFALGRDFDPIRAFVRYGEGDLDWREFVQIRQDPILADDTRRWRQTDGHLVTVQWDGGLTGIFAQVSLFNAWTYVVKLAPRFGGIFRKVASGHLFSVRGRRVSPLTGVGLIMPVQAALPLE